MIPLFQDLVEHGGVARRRRIHRHRLALDVGEGLHVLRRDDAVQARMHAADGDEIEIVILRAALPFGMGHDVVEGGGGELILAFHQVADLFEGAGRAVETDLQPFLLEKAAVDGRPHRQVRAAAEPDHVHGRLRLGAHCADHECHSSDCRFLHVSFLPWSTIIP